MKKYVINPNLFDGEILTTISPSDELGCSKYAWDRYNQVHGDELLVLSWEELYEKWIKPYDANLQQPWIECTITDYNCAIESQSEPPIKCEIIGGYRTFLCSKETVRSIHRMYASKGNRCWTALRSIDCSMLALRDELLPLLSYMTAHVESFDRQSNKLKIRESAITLLIKPNEIYDFRVDAKWEFYYSIINHVPTVCTARKIYALQHS